MRKNVKKKNESANSRNSGHAHPETQEESEVEAKVEAEARVGREGDEIIIAKSQLNVLLF